MDSVLQSDAAKSAPPTRESIDYSIKTGKNLQETINQAIEAKDALELSKQYPELDRLQPVTAAPKKDKEGNHVNVTIQEGLEGKSQNFRMTYPTYNGAEPTNELGMPIDKKVAEAEFHAKSSKGDNVKVEG